MTPLDEKTYLAALLQQIDNGPPAWLQRKSLDFFLWAATALLFVVLFQLGKHISPLLLALGALAIGIAVGYLTLLQCVAKNWSALRPHVSRDTVVARLAELEP